MPRGPYRPHIRPLAQRAIRARLCADEPLSAVSARIPRRVREWLAEGAIAPSISESVAELLVAAYEAVSGEGDDD